MSSSCLHFIGFRDDRSWSAVKIWGYPDFIHPVWDRPAANEIFEGDVAIFATGDEDAAPSVYSWNDSERL